MLVIMAAVGLGRRAADGRASDYGDLERPGSSRPRLKCSSIPAVLNQIKLGPITKMAAVLPRDGKGGDLLVYIYGIGDSRYSVALIDGASHAARWQSQPLSKDAYQGQLVAGQDMIYLTDQDQLLALRLSDGTLAWQTALAVEPQSGCDDCVRLLGGHVIVLEKNSGLQVVRCPDRQAGLEQAAAATTRASCRSPATGW